MNQEDKTVGREEIRLKREFSWALKKTLLKGVACLEKVLQKFSATFPVNLQRTLIQVPRGQALLLYERVQQYRASMSLSKAPRWTKL